MQVGISQTSSRFRRQAAVAAAVLAALLTLSGCVRVQAALAVSDRDTVSGKVVVASVVLRSDDKGPAVTVPPELTAKVRVTPYNADNYVGSSVEFTDLTFPEISLLAQTLTEGKRYRLTFRRAGGLVTLAGSADLSELPADRADVQLKVAFPGTVLQTNGVNDNGTVSWTPKPGAVTEFTATVEYNDQSGVSWTKWVMIVGASAVGVALLVLGLALWTHRRERRLSAAGRT